MKIQVCYSKDADDPGVADLFVPAHLRSGLKCPKKIKTTNEENAAHEPTPRSPNLTEIRGAGTPLPRRPPPLFPLLLFDVHYADPGHLLQHSE